MHEMALCESVLQVLEEQARVQDFQRISRVRLEIGRLSGVEIAALRFGFEVVTRGSLAEGARLDILEPPGTAWCMPCEAVVEIARRGDPCPDCGSHQLQVTGGDQMNIKDLEVE